MVIRLRVRRFDGDVWRTIVGTAVSDVETTPNIPPVAVIGVTTSALVASFSGAGSNDSDGSIVSYSWDFGDGATSTLATPNHTYPGDGTYTVTLRVVDNNGSTGTATRELTVSSPVVNQPPTASFTATSSGLSVTANSTSSVDPGGSLVSRTWNWGDGTASTGTIASHSYASAGTYTITLTVTDDGGLKDTATQTVTVTAPSVGFTRGTEATPNNMGTGLIAPKPTTIVTGTVTVSAGQTLENVIVVGRVVMTGANPTLRNVEVRGNISSGEAQVVDTTAATNALIDFCEIWNTTGWGGANGVGKKNFTLNRSYVHHVVDCVRINNTANHGGPVAATVRDSLLGEQILDTPDPLYTRTDKKTHSDGIQIEDGTGILIEGCTIPGMHTTDGTSSVVNTTSSYPFTPVTSGGIAHPQALSAIMISPYSGAVISVTIRQNFLGGGEVTINGADSASGSITNNKFYRTSLQSVAIYPTSGGTTRSGNTYIDNGAAVTGG